VRFRTTLDFDREYLRNGLTYRKSKGNWSTATPDWERRVASRLALPQIYTSKNALYLDLEVDTTCDGMLFTSSHFQCLIGRYSNNFEITEYSAIVRFAVRAYKRECDNCGWTGKSAALVPFVGASRFPNLFHKASSLLQFVLEIFPIILREPHSSVSAIWKWGPFSSV